MKGSSSTYAKISATAWYLQIPISAAGYFLLPSKVFFGYLVGISVWTGIESAHSRLNAAKAEEK